MQAFRFVLLSLACGTLLMVSAEPRLAFGQGGGIGGGGGGGIGGGGGNNGGGGAAGITIDAEGVVQPALSQERATKLDQARAKAFAEERLGENFNAPSKLRKVSLVELEKRLKTAAGSEDPLPLELKYLAGLNRIDFIFVDAESKDIILGGPAEGFGPDSQGRMVGIESGRPPIRVDDLLTALRALWSSQGYIGCSIDPEPQNLQNLQTLAQRMAASAVTPAVAAQRYKTMARVLGRQVVTVQGVPPQSHFAHALVEADYRMKRISLGLEQTGVRGISSHLQLLVPNGNSIQRWWFTPLYEGLYVNTDRTAFELAGQRVQLMSQEEQISGSGDRSDSAFTRASTQRFAQNFTKNYEDLAERSPIFAELQNLFDLAVVAALMKNENLPGRIGWEMAALLDPSTLPNETWPVPKHVQSESVQKRANRGMILGLVGGVTINLRPIANSLEPKEEFPVRWQQPETVAEANESPWWWD